MRALLRLFAALVVFLLADSPAQAQQFWTKSALLADMFPASNEVAPVVLTLDDAQRARFVALLGYQPPSPAYTVYRARTDAHVDGWVVFDDEVGQHQPITFAVQLGADGRVVRDEIVVYREKYGADVRAARFRDQFVGKAAADPMVPGKDILIVSGATYSSKSLARGVKRAALIGTLAIEADAGAPPVR